MIGWYMLERPGGNGLDARLWEVGAMEVLGAGLAPVILVLSLHAPCGQQFKSSVFQMCPAGIGTATRMSTAVLLVT